MRYDKGVPIYISNPSSPLCLTITIRTMRYVTNDASKIPAERHVFINLYFLDIFYYLCGLVTVLPFILTYLTYRNWSR